MTIEQIDTSADIEILPPQRPAAADALGQLMAHAEAMGAAKQLADALCASDLVPAVYKGKPGNGAAAILYGAELGLNPIQSLQQIFVVHGSPAIYARTAVALVMRQGITVQTISSTDESVTVRATRGNVVEESTWDIKRASTAGYTGNAKYKTDPQAMLFAKAAMEVCRKVAPDVLLGIPYAREELEIESRDQPRRVPSDRRGVEGLRRALAPARSQPEHPLVAGVIEAEPEAPPPDPDAMSPAARRKWLNRMFALFSEADCTEREDQLLVITEITARQGNPPQSRDDITDDQLRSVVNNLNAFQKEGILGGRVTEILNRAVLQAEGIEVEQ